MTTAMGIHSATAISSATFPMPSSAPSYPSSPPRTAPARRSSPAGGVLSGAPRLSTSTRATSAPTISSASPSSPGYSPSTLAPPAAFPSPTSASARPVRASLRTLPRSRPGFMPDASTTFGSSKSTSDSSTKYMSSRNSTRCHHPCSVWHQQARIGFCDFPIEIAPSVNFPLLKQLTLTLVSISDQVLHVVLTACHVLETLYLEIIIDMGCLHISSSTLRAIGFNAYACMEKEELVIVDTPLLERLLCLGFYGTIDIIRVISAPKLEILGPLSPHISNIHIANLFLQGMIPASLSHSIHTVKVLALGFFESDLNAVLWILRCFPCLEKLYVIWDQYLETHVKNARRYDPLDPVKCLETHLKVLVLKNYQGGEEEVSFARFFVLNAKVVQEILFGVNENIDKEWVAYQHSLLGVEAKASRGAQFVFRSGSSYFGNCLTCRLQIPSTALL
uniref:Uncharacterized protein n=1 Tax=Avena sativa TaxID=4498 RepID=A0ACD5W6J8_AVESA